MVQSHWISTAQKGYGMSDHHHHTTSKNSIRYLLDKLRWRRYGQLWSYRNRIDYAADDIRCRQLGEQEQHLFTLPIHFQRTNPVVVSWESTHSDSWLSFQGFLLFVIVHKDYAVIFWFNKIVWQGLIWLLEMKILVLTTLTNSFQQCVRISSLKSGRENIKSRDAWCLPHF